MTVEKPWYTQLRELMKSDSDIRKRIQDKIPAGTISTIIAGNSNLDRMNKGRRAFLYEVSGIEDFRFDGYVELNTIDMNLITEGKQPLENATLWLGYHGLTLSYLSEKTKLDENSVRKLLAGKEVRGDCKDRLYKVLRNEYRERNGGVEDRSGVGVESKVEESTISNDNNEVNAYLKNLTGKVSDIHKVLGFLNEKPGLEERIQSASFAVDILVNQLEYFAGASKEEREELARKLREQEQITRFGWIYKVLGNITEPDGTLNTFPRLTGPPAKKNRSKK
jgi:hypothetical protein